MLDIFALVQYQNNRLEQLWEIEHSTYGNNSHQIIQSENIEVSKMNAKFYESVIGAMYVATII